MNSVDSLIKTPFTLRTLEEKIEIKTLGRPTPNLLNFTQKINSEKRSFTRNFKNDQYEKCSWLCGCDSRIALFCFPCLLLGGEDSWTKTGFKDLNHLTDRIKKHEVSGAHVKNSLQLALLGTCNIVEQLDSAYRRNIAAHNEQVKQNRYVLNIIINCVRFCGAFELALRGHNEKKDSTNPGVFRGLIDFSAELNLVLKAHLESSTVFKGTSKTIQNELLQIMLEVCQDKITEEIKDVKFLAIIADETSDVSNIFQMAIVYRYIVKNKPVERFWTFLNPLQHDAASLAACILKQLEYHKINCTPHKLIAQTYDGASVMAGVHNGVKALIQNIYSDAQYIHCHAHQLNLVMMRAASINREVRIFFANVQGLCAFFSTSPQRTAILDDVVQKRLPRSVPTRWNFQSRGVTTIYEHRKNLVECMNTILQSDYINNDSTICQASGHLKVLKNQNFIFWLSFFNKIMPYLDILFGHLQQTKTDPTITKKRLLSFEENMFKVRNEIDLDKSEKEEQQAESSFPKRRKMDTDEMKRQAKEVCDVITTQIKERFKFTGHLSATSLFSSDKFPDYDSKFPEDILKCVCEDYKCVNSKKLKIELSTLYSANEFRKMSGALSLYNFLKDNELEETFSETIKILEILITIPMTTCEAERCFSTLKRIKTFLRNTMTEERLSALAMLSIEKDLIMEIPDFNEKVINKFAQQKERRMDFLYK